MARLKEVLHHSQGGPPGLCRAWIWRLRSTCTNLLPILSPTPSYRQRLKNEAKAMGSALSARQSLTLASRRKDLAGRLISHRTMATTWVSRSSTSLQMATDGAPQGHPESQSSLLPSTYAPGLLNSLNNEAIIAMGQVLRRANCLKALQTLRSVAMQHAHLVSAKSKHARRIKAVTRAEALTHRLQAKLEFVQWEYSHSRAHLRMLGMTSRDQTTFLALRASDIQELKSTVSRQGQLGEGRITLPWYWRVNLADEGYNESSINATAQDVAAEYQESKYLHQFAAAPSEQTDAVRECGSNT